MNQKKEELFGYESYDIETPFFFKKIAEKRKKHKKSRIVVCITLVCSVALILSLSFFVKSQNEKTVKAKGMSRGIEKEAHIETQESAKALEGAPVVTSDSNALINESSDNSSSDIVMSDTSRSGEHPYFIRVNRKLNVVTVYMKDSEGNYTVPFKAMVCSVGLNNATPTGTFKTSTKYEWHALYANTFGQYAYRINGPIMFHSVPYYSENKDSLETEEYNKLGRAASLGCIRLSVSDAKWIIDNCPEGTTVEIYDSDNPGPFGKPMNINIDPGSKNAGWDPTDPDPSNPWLNE
jgi:lipoprotein-anchoring transpeptidase ErfK/SrfK